MRITKFAPIGAVIVITIIALIFFFEQSTPASRTISLVNTKIETPIKHNNPKGIMFEGFNSKGWSDSQVEHNKDLPYDYRTFNFTVNETEPVRIMFGNPNFDPAENLTMSIDVKYKIDNNDPVSQTLVIPPIQHKSVNLTMAAGQRLVGSFNVTGVGGPSHDINFDISSPRCDQTVDSSFVVVNSSTANGTAIVQLLSDGKVVWSNTYFVPASRLVGGHGSVDIGDCDSHSYVLIAKS